MFSLDDLEQATSVVRSVMPPTPQYAWPLLRRRYGVELVVKHENHTPIGAFKVRQGWVGGHEGAAGLLSSAVPTFSESSQRRGEREHRDLCAGADKAHSPNLCPMCDYDSSRMPPLIPATASYRACSYADM